MPSGPERRRAALARGARFEVQAEDWLAQRGLEPVSRNYSYRGGEIDLVMRDGDALVFVEVRYRASSRFGDAAESIDGAKRARIVRAAQHYLKRHVGSAEPPCRFDVVAINGSPPELRVDWIADAFSA